MSERCPCGSGDIYPDCCGRFHIGPAVAATAKDLMRSRFSAFAVGDAAYLLTTWHPSTRPTELVLDAATRWQRLDVIEAARGGLFDDDGTVEFRAHFRADGRRGTLHEISRFVREGGRWYYVDGVIQPT